MSPHIDDSASPSLTLHPHRPAYKRSRTRDSFRAEGSFHQHMQNLSNPGAAVDQAFAGIGVKRLENGVYRYSIAFHDGNDHIGHDVKDIPTFRRDEGSSGESSASGSGTSTPISPQDLPVVLATQVLDRIRDWRDRKLFKVMGIGMTQDTAALSPKLAMHLWSDLDIVPFIFSPETDSTRDPASLTVAEEAESMARKTVKQFTVKGHVRITTGYHHEVEVDCDGRAQITDIDTYRHTVNKRTTWPATMKYAESLKRKDTKIAFFNTTPQGGGVALMRHALIRYLRLIGVNCTWYVPYGRPEVFRITKDNHNILQGVATHGERFTEGRRKELDTWIAEEAERCRWLEGDGPLAAREQGGADVIIVDDPQMPSLVKLAKERDPHRPVIFRSHIQVRGDLADQEGTATAEVWNWIWNHVKDCDVFVSHPVRSFVPKNVTPDKVGYLPATTDWLDGLNKTMQEWDNQYYIHEFGAQCFRAGMRQLDYPNRDYIVQIARFDPAKGIDDVLASYNELRKEYMKDLPKERIPQLVIAGHGAVDDPDATRIYDETEAALATQYSDIQDDVIVMRLGPSDQILNALMSCAHVALQLSTREGFEVKVSEALHKGIPIIATRAGGIPLQVQDGKSGFLVKPRDYKAVAKHLFDLFTDHALHAEMQKFAASHVSDEVSTVGNALAWLYLADTLAKGETIKPNGRWINDLARETAGFPYVEGETRLPRAV